MEQVYFKLCKNIISILPQTIFYIVYNNSLVTALKSNSTEQIANIHDRFDLQHGSLNIFHKRIIILRMYRFQRPPLSPLLP